MNTRINNTKTVSKTSTTNSTPKRKSSEILHKRYKKGKYDRNNTRIIKCYWDLLPTDILKFISRQYLYPCRQLFYMCGWDISDTISIIPSNFQISKLNGMTHSDLQQYYLLKYEVEWLRHNALYWCIDNGYFNLFKSLSETVVECKKYDINALVVLAIQTNRFNIFEYLLSDKYALKRNSRKFYSLKFWTEMIQVENNMQWFQVVTKDLERLTSANGGKLPVAFFPHGILSVMARAVSKEQPDIVRWFIKMGFQFHSSALYHSVEMGNIEITKILIEESGIIELNSSYIWYDLIKIHDRNSEISKYLQEKQKEEIIKLRLQYHPFSTEDSSEDSLLE
jgi:hypothetical protein